MKNKDFFNNDRYQKWIWIELIGFDNTKSDFGIDGYISRAGFVPDGFSLLLSWTGFALDHDGGCGDKYLSPAECSYSGHEYSPERRRQQWTGKQLREFIAALRGRGIKVYLSYFNFNGYVSDDGNYIRCGFYDGKDYLYETDRSGSPAGGVCMLKRLPDGSYFEDILQEKTVEVLKYYGFDGIQIADGISSPRVSLQNGDYSDDMIGQFMQTGVKLPDDFGANINGDPEALKLRAEYIWRNLRSEWINFNADRWNIFYGKFIKRLSEANLESIFNSAWTRDPFEAIYRYGVDYRRVSGMGIQGCMVEDVSGGLSILSEQDNAYLMNDEQRKKVHYEFITALMLNRAAMPGIRITPLAGIHDTLEQWGVLEHMPTLMTRNVMTNLNTYIVTREGLKSVTDGPYFCLGDSLKASDWDFIRQNWNTGATDSPLSVEGVTLLWSDERLDAELGEFIASRRTPTHKITSELLYAGAPVNAAVRIEDIDTEYMRGPLLVTNPSLLPEKQTELLLKYNGAIFAVDAAGNNPPDGFSLLAEEQNSFGGICLYVKNSTGLSKPLPPPVIINNPEPYMFDPAVSLEPYGMIWTHPLSFAPVSPRFYAACRDLIIDLTNAPAVKTTGEYQPCKIICVNISQDKCRLFISNDDYFYNIPSVDLKRPIKSVTCLTKYSGYKVDFHGSELRSRVACRGMECFEVCFK